MTMNDRLKELRKACKKSQAEFADVLGLSRNAITEIESGRNCVLDRHLAMLSNWKEFRVNVDWIRTGEGEMFLEDESDALEKVKQDYHLNDAQFAFICEYIHLPEEDRNVILNFMISVVEAQRRRKEKTIEEEVAEYRQQLEKEKEAETSSASSEGKDNNNIMRA